MPYVEDHFHIQSITSEAQVSGTREIVCCTFKSRHGLVTIEEAHLFLE